MADILHTVFIVWCIGSVILVWSLNLLVYQKQWLFAMMDQVDREGVIHQDRINVRLGKNPAQLAALIRALPDEELDAKYFKYRSIRADVRSIRRFTRTWRTIALIWAGLFVVIMIVRDL